MFIAKQYTDQFRADALDLLERTDRSLPAVARDLGVSPQCLRNWYNAAQMAKKKKPSRQRRSTRSASSEPASAEAEMKRLERELAAARKEIEELKTDREILKKAAAFFAKESE